MSESRRRAIVRRPWGSFVLFALVLAASAGGILILGASAARGTAFEKYSTYKAEPDGASAVFETLQDMGFKPTRETEDLRALPPDGSLLVLVGPFATGDPSLPPTTGAKPSPLAALGAPMPPAEVEGIVEWVRKGGRLLVLEGHDNALYRALKVEVRGQPEPLENLTFEGRPATFATYTATGARLSLANRASFDTGSGDWTTLWRDKDGAPVGISSPLGEGEVVLFSDPQIATNDGLRRAGNLEALYEVAAGSPHDVRTVRFDELRHGFASTRNVMGYARRQGLHLAVVQAGLAFVLAVWAAARARRRPRGEVARSRIESREFVSAMANIYSRARVGEHAARSFFRRCEHALATALGAHPARRTDEVVAARLREIGVRNFRGWESVREEALALGLAADVFPPDPPKAGDPEPAPDAPKPPVPPTPPADPRRRWKVPDRRLLAFARLTSNLEREVRAAARISVDEVL